MSAHGTYQHVSGRPALRFERRLRHPVVDVWRAVTEPGELVAWFPQAVELDGLTAGARVAFRFAGEDRVADTGRVVDAHPPHLLAFTWFGDILTFELDPLGEDKGTVLRFTDMIAEVSAAARTMAGWHVCLDRLAGHLDGERAKAPDTTAWRALYDGYVARGVPHGAPIP